MKDATTPIDFEDLGKGRTKVTMTVRFMKKNGPTGPNDATDDEDEIRLNPAKISGWQCKLRRDPITFSRGLKKPGLSAPALFIATTFANFARSNALIGSGGTYLSLY